jgi:hypothetical protein
MEKEAFYAKSQLLSHESFYSIDLSRLMAFPNGERFLRTACQVFEEHECGRILVRAGAPIKTTAGILGHTDSKTIMLHLGVDQQDMTHANT